MAGLGGGAGRGGARERAGGGADARAGVPAGCCGDERGLRLFGLSWERKCGAPATATAPEGVGALAATLTLVERRLPRAAVAFLVIAREPP
jgi:hypothetical protein